MARMACWWSRKSRPWPRRWGVCVLTPPSLRSWAEVDGNTSNRGGPGSGVGLSSMRYCGQRPESHLVRLGTGGCPSMDSAVVSAAPHSHQLSQHANRITRVAAVKSAVLFAAWSVKESLNYTWLRLRRPRFRLLGAVYPIHVAMYNKSWRNERQVELPPA